MEGEETQTNDENVMETVIIEDDEAQIINDSDTKSIQDDEEPSVYAVNVIATTNQDEPVMVDLANKVAVTYNVLKACIKEKSENVYYYMDYIVSRLAYLTNMHKNVLNKIMKNAKDPKKTDILEETVLETPDIDFLIRQTLVKYYVKSNKIPRTESLTHITSEHWYSYELHQHLKRSGYIWRRLPKLKRAIIVEHPLRVIQRQRYLQKIGNYRKKKRRIVYIETKILSKADKHIHYFQNYLSEAVNFIVVFIAVVNDDKGFLNGHIFASKSIYICQKLIEDYIIKSVVPSLSGPSVIVLEDKPYYRKSLPVPTIESKKSEMIKWLKINGLPHEENVHRSELFDIIQRCKDKHDLHDFDADLFAHGHEILRRPTRTDYLNYYKYLWANISSNEDVTVFISKKSPDYWENLEIALIRTEKSVLCEDLEMENITDKILTMANNVDVKEWADTECDVEEDSLAQDEFIFEIKNSFSPEELQVRERQLLFEVKKFERILN